MAKVTFHRLGQELLERCQSATNEVILVAPFVKQHALEKLLDAVSESVSVRCVTRWHPSEIAAGASDVEVWLTLKGHSNSTLYLRQNLHAKFYRFDDSCLIGSANITFSALAWKSPPNLEMLVTCSANDPGVVAFERDLFDHAVLVTDAIYQRTMEAVEQLPKMPEPELPIDESTALLVAESDTPYMSSFQHQVWIPRLRHPEDLFKAYTRQWERLSKSSRQVAIKELEILMLPTGLDRNAFDAYVGAMLLQQPIVQTVDSFVAIPRRFGAVRTHLASKYGDDPDFDASEVWQTLMRWLLHFLPDRYERYVPNYSEIFRRVED